MKILEMKDVGVVRGHGANYRLCIEDFHVTRGEMTAIVGPSGCGKSTALDLIGLILKPDHADSFWLRGSAKEYDLASLWRRNDLATLTDVRRTSMGYVLQTGELLGFLSVRENILLSALVAGVKAEEAAQRCEELMARLEIGHLASKKPGTLSIGERQRTAIARALSPRPELVLADEPTAALDPELSARVMRLFTETASSYDTAIIMVTHEISLADQFDFIKVPITLTGTEQGTVATLCR